ncbi:ABC transporter ATP-binding protein [Candidatus Methylopumilus universalis]|uniref:ABC transporter ATP-binding protein n=1 Tax=Candidatus Methylopumilus universalis TaxID=2588536 RepID=A0AAX1F0R4_9PROT|nr:ABC transporter ATP-binding protein [Candidatus Methylopumilus universalis]QDC41658.1 ABC transporter ATP-binding protein [Candidatus Methylopumilus universalis]QDC42939.1 ABC transporter ATP-binding protein [Candidatus Methylopumilus universalis]QDC55328.1 ABC transporter ATP-binding protein [Candidatus Methylopumilus universalis]QDC56607.1 ABC transporter ATP-binding protein [Candidatus Methylopumilus universalis]QDC57898.1 ABC transporter ATP-binding protein [Candidatus Methylopumilus un
MTKKVIEIQGLYKDYNTAAGVFPVLKDVNLTIDDGDYVAIMGPSGSGKSTFMNILGCLDRPTKGEYILDGHSIKSLSSNELAKLRNKTIGFVFQGFNLLARSTLVENVSLPLVYAENQKELRTKIAKNILERMGLGNYFDSKPSQISGGQQQRVAIARALVNQPRIILADEPTGNLDSKTSDEIMKIFDELNQIGNTIIIVTHENDIAEHASRQVRFLDGKIVEDSRNKKEKAEA